MDLLRQRLHAQRLSRHDLETPAAVVRALAAVQAQDEPSGRWAIGARLADGTAGDVDAAIAAFAIVRTWPMRGTLHYVDAADVRWLLAHLAPRVIAKSAARHRELGLDANAFKKAHALIEPALTGKNRLSRPDVMALLERGGVDPSGQRGVHIVAVLAQEGLICFGPAIGKQQSFVLLEEHVPSAKMLEREDALVELARRFFTSHGPATDRDFAWWAGLTLTEARAGLEGAKGDLVRGDVEGRAFFHAPTPARAKLAEVPAALLLPAWDEYTVAYVERAELVDERCRAQLTKSDLLRPVVVVAGRAVGTWTRTLKKGGVDVHVHVDCTLTAAERRAIDGAKQRYAGFLGVPLITPPARS